MSERIVEQHAPSQPDAAKDVKRTEEEMKQLNLAYKRLIDQYHDELERERVRSGKTVVGSLTPGEAFALTAKRNETHRQLLELGAKLGFGRDQVLADLVRREGNLGEYGIPEFGLLGHDEGYLGMWPIDLWTDPKTMTFSFDSAEKNPWFTHQEMAGWKQKEREMKRQNGYQDEELDEEDVLIGPDGLVETSSLRLQEVAVIFGAKFLDAMYGMVEMVPQEYPERERRARAAAKEYGLKVFQHMAYAPHDATSFIGIVVPVGRLDEIANRLRGDRDRFGIRPEDLDPEVVARDRKEVLAEAWNEVHGMSKYAWENYVTQRESFLGDELTDEERVDLIPKEMVVEDPFEADEPPVRGARRSSGVTKKPRI